MTQRRILTTTAAIAAAIALSGCLGSKKNDEDTNALPEFEGLTPAQVQQAYNTVLALEETPLVADQIETRIDGNYTGAMLVEGADENGAFRLTADLDVDVDWDASAPVDDPFSGSATNFAVFQGGQTALVTGQLDVDGGAGNTIDGNTSMFSMTGDLTYEGEQESFQADFAGTFYGENAEGNAGTVDFLNVSEGGEEFGSGIYYLNAD